MGAYVGGFCGGGSEVTIDGAAVKEKLSLKQMPSIVKVGKCSSYVYATVVALGNDIRDIYALQNTTMFRMVEGEYDITYEIYLTIPIKVSTGDCGAFMHEGKLYAWEKSSLYRFNESDGSWVLHATLPHGYVGSMCGCNGKIYAIGSSQSSYRSNAYVLNNDDSWTSLKVTNLGSDCALIPNGTKIHVIGWKYGGNTYKGVKTYDTVSNTWADGATTPFYTNRFGYLGKKNRQCFFTQYTGYSSDDSSVAWAKFDLDSETWITVENALQKCCITAHVSEFNNTLMCALSGSSSSDTTDIVLYDNRTYTEEWS